MTCFGKKENCSFIAGCSFFYRHCEEPVKSHGLNTAHGDDLSRSLRESNLPLMKVVLNFEFASAQMRLTSE